MKIIKRFSIKNWPHSLLNTTTKLTPLLTLLTGLNKPFCPVKRIFSVKTVIVNLSHSCSNWVERIDGPDDKQHLEDDTCASAIRHVELGTRCQKTHKVGDLFFLSDNMEAQVTPLPQQPLINNTHLQLLSEILDSFSKEEMRVYMRNIIIYFKISTNDHISSELLMLYSAICVAHHGYLWCLSCVKDCISQTRCIFQGLPKAM